MKIKLLALDVDGTLTDGGIQITESGEPIRTYNTKDGLGLEAAMRDGVAVGIVSNSRSAGSIRARAAMLGISRCHVGPGSKLEVVRHWSTELGVELDCVAYIGDDLNDLDVLQAVGLSACPADAVEAVRRACHVVLRRKGGEGCVREFIDRYLLAPAQPA